MPQKTLKDIADKIIGLHGRGYTLDFTVLGTKLICLQDRSLLSPNDYFITDTAFYNENTIICGIEAPDFAIKGILFQKTGTLSSESALY